MKAARAKLSLKARAVQWLSMREHSRVELRRKLLAQIAKEARQARKFSAEHHDATASDDNDQNAAAAPAAIDDLLDELTKLGFLSEQRFVESRVRTRAPRHGNQRIRAELAQHGVAINANQNKVLIESEQSRAHDLWQRRFGGTRSDDRDARLKQMRFLASRGFASDTIRIVVEGKFKPEESG